MSSFFNPLAACALAGFALVGSTTLQAADGVYEINQACVAQGCYPGDGPGFPVNITAPGSYRVTSNITVTAADTSAIIIDADNVHLDLGGFTLKGPVVCSGTPIACTPVNPNSYGVHGLGAARNAIVRNGFLTGFRTGVKTDVAWQILNIVASRNVHGYNVHGSVLRECTAQRNQEWGFNGTRIVVKDSISEYNAGFGIQTADAVIENTMVHFNGNGIRDVGRSRIADSMIVDNVGYGIQSEHGGGIFVGNRITSNGGLGIELLGGTAYGGALPVALGNNSLSNNAGTLAGAQIGGAGTYVQTGSNQCGTDLVCP